MVEQNAIVRHVRAGLEQDRRINVRRHPIRVTVDDGAVILEGDVDGIAAKKLALEVAARTPSVRGVVDRLRVAVAERRGDGAMRAALCEALLQQPELRRCTIRVDAKGRVDTLRDAGGDRTGELEVSVVVNRIVAGKGA